MGNLDRFSDMLDIFILSFTITSWSENNQTLIKPISRADYASKRLGCVKATVHLIYWAISWRVIDHLVAVTKKQHVAGEKKH